MLRSRIWRMITPADMVTLGSGLLGIGAIVAGLQLHMLYLAFALLVLAVVGDGIDGAIARRLRWKGGLGASLDSTSGFLSFCVAPGLLAFEVYRLGPSHPLGGWIDGVLLLACSFHVACGALRQARYAMVDRSGLDHFLGLPTPANALLVVGLLAVRPPWIVAFASIVLLAFLMVSDQRVPRPGESSVLWAGAGALAVATLTALVWTEVAGHMGFGVRAFLLLELLLAAGLALAPFTRSGPVRRDARIVTD